MIRLAELLWLEFNKIRFRSLVNRRVFSLVFSGGSFELVELDGADARAFVNRFLYQGSDAEEVKKVILQEVCDVG
jgi:hypothetical protein